MKRTLACAGAGALITALTACTGTGTAPTASQPSAGHADPKIEAIVPASLKSKTITMATDASYAPFESYAADHTTIVGFDVDMVNAAFAKMGLKAQIVNAGFDTIIPGLAAGRYDLSASAFAVTAERAKVVDFVDYMQGGSALAVAKGNPQNLRMDPLALCGRPIGAEKGSTQAIDQLPAIQQKCQAAGKQAVDVQLYPSTDAMELALTSGRVVAVFSGGTGLAVQTKASQGKIELAPGPLYDPVPDGVAFPKDSPLVKPFAAAVKAMYADGSMKALAHKWGLPDADMLPAAELR
ncbi:MAG TPA: ABC transporter substrate-binding protein [Microbacterium sp.]|nr:ABC transporter substrate-binding protein [Microbacterium sp.]